MRRSAERGFVHGMEGLGNLYMMGKFVPHNYNEALYWLRLAADRQDSDAERDLGLCYEMG